MFFCAGVFGIALGLLLANTVNTKNIENFTEFTTALPTRLLDINGELITEFSSDEKRETEPFFREDKSRSRKLGGAGLGLSLCKEIARLHGTELLFESELGKGTTVSFTLEKGGEKA